MKQLVPDIFAVLGLGLLTYGGHLAYPPLLYIVPGVALIALGIMGARKWA